MEDLPNDKSTDSLPEGLTARWAGRRLMDAVAEVFELALLRNDLRTATDLLTVMKRRAEREQGRTSSEQRHGNPMFDRAQRQLQTRVERQRREQAAKAAQQPAENKSPARSSN
jgi:hypothetical protein